MAKMYIQIHNIDSEKDAYKSQQYRYKAHHYEGIEDNCYLVSQSLDWIYKMKIIMNSSDQKNMLIAYWEGEKWRLRKNYYNDGCTSIISKRLLWDFIKGKINYMIIKKAHIKVGLYKGIFYQAWDLVYRHYS